jgi:hypothetical protein
VPPRESRLRNLETGHLLFVGVLCLCVRCVCMCIGVCVCAPFARDNVCGGGREREGDRRERACATEGMCVCVCVCLSVCLSDFVAVSVYLCIHIEGIVGVICI